MDQQYTKFVDTLMNLVKDLNRYYPNDPCKNFIDNFDKLDIGKIMVRFLSIMRDYETQLSARDESMFSSDTVLLPSINLSTIWTHLRSGQKNKIWTYLQILYYQSELLLNTDECINQESDKHQVLENIKQDVIQFNPYVGVGEESEDYGVNTMTSEKLDLEDLKNFKPGLDTMISALGIDKKLDLESLRNQLKNMSKEEIHEATATLKNVLGAKAVNPKTANMIETMLSSISEELQNDTGNDNENPLNKIIKIAEVVANKMQPKMQSNNVNIQDLWTSTQNVAQDFKDEKGNPVFANGNPLANLGNLFGNLNNQSSVPQNKNMNLQGLPNLTPEQQRQMAMMMNGMMNPPKQTNNSRKKRK